MKTERTHWIDIARGIGIIFIIYGHLLVKESSSFLLYSFHIPLFFFLSGAVYNPRKYANFFTFLKKSAKTLLLPYFVVSFIFFVLWLTGLKSHELFSHQSIKQFLSIFYANSDIFMVFNAVLWFLPALFVTRLLFAVVYRQFTQTRTIILALLCFSVFGYLLAVVFAPNLKLPFGAEVALSAVVFYGAGFLWNQSEKAKALLFKYKYFLFILLLALGSYITTVDFNTFGQ